MILPSGGKFEEKDRDTVGRALRETEEEIGSHLFGATGYFIDEKGQPLDYPTAVNTESFIFPDGTRGDRRLLSLPTYTMTRHSIKKRFGSILDE